MWFGFFISLASHTDTKKCISTMTWIFQTSVKKLFSTVLFMLQKFMTFKGITNLFCISSDKSCKHLAWVPFSLPGSHKRLLMDVSKSQIRLVRRKIGLEGILSCYTTPPRITVWVKDKFSYHIGLKIFVQGESWPFQAICSSRFWSSELS